MKPIKAFSNTRVDNGVTVIPSDVRELSIDNLIVGGK